MRAHHRRGLAIGGCTLALLVASGAHAVAGQKKTTTKASAGKMFCAPEDVVVWKGGHRIPAVLLTSKGTLLVFAEQRHNSSDHGNVDLVLKRSSDNGKTWSKPMLIHDSGNRASGNPCPIQDRETGTIWLLFARNNNKQAMVTHSKDDGRTWAKPLPLEKPTPVRNRHAKPVKKKDAWIATGPCQGIQLASGRLLAPANVHRSFSYYSDDHGKTWKHSNLIANTSANECTAVELADGSVYMNLRLPGGRGNHHRASVVSKDGGKTWPLKARHEPQLPGPACHMGVVRFTDEKRHDRNRILFSGPAGPRKRADLMIRISYDECRTWQECRLVKRGRASYSNMVVLPDMSIGCVYETSDGGWQSIRFARFTLEWLTKDKDKLDRSKFKPSGNK